MFGLGGPAPSWSFEAEVNHLREPGRRDTSEASTSPQVRLMMPVWPEAPPPSDHHGDAAPRQDPTAKEEQRGGGWSLEEDLEEFGGLAWPPPPPQVSLAPLTCDSVSRLDRKWLLWHDFMREHAHLEAWLHPTEQALTCASPAHITYSGAKEQLRRLEVSRNTSVPAKEP